MKKIIIIVSFFILLSSCYKEEIRQNENKTNTGSIKESSNKKELIKEKDGNIYLYENGIKIETLTTRATGKTECEIENDEFYVYTITNQNSNYGIVKREQYVCGVHYTGITYFGIDLVNNTELTELPIGGEVKTELENNTIKITILSPETIVDKVLDARIETSKEDMISEGFIQKGNDWVKIINLKDIIKAEIKKEEKVETSKIEIKKVETPKIDNKYSNDNLIKNGYKLNNIGNIKEYYKISKEDNNQGNGGLVYMYNTIYIQGDKILEIIGSDSDTTSGFMASITIYDGKNTKIINEDEIGKFEYGFPIQAIFNENGPKILIYEGLNKVNIVDKSQGLSKTIWER